MQNSKAKPKSIDQQIEDFKALMRAQGYKVDVIIEDYEQNR